MSPDTPSEKAEARPGSCIEGDERLIGLEVVAQTGDGPIRGRITQTDEDGVTLRSGEWFEQVTWECLYPRAALSTSPDTETRGEAIDRITGCWHSTPRCDACRPAPPDTAPPEGATFTGADRRALLRLAERLQLQSEEADDAGAQVWAARYRSEHYAIHRVLAALDGPASAPPASEGEAVKAIESEARRFAQKGGKFNEAKALGLAEAAHILRTFAPVEGETREWTIPVCEGCDFPEIGAGETECPDCELPVEWIVVRYMRPAPEPKGGRVPAPTEARAEGEAG